MTEVPTVLVVDDDDSFRKALTRLFRSVGFDVQAFASPDAFLAHPLPDAPTCVVLDLRMPGSSGLTVQDRLARTRADVSIVFLSGHGDVASTVRAMRAGAVDFLEKPMNEQVLLETVQRGLERARQARAESTERDELRRRVATLTPREREVFALVTSGLPNKLVADRLGSAEKTVKLHRARVMAKMRAESLVDLVRMASLAGVDPSAVAPGRRPS